MPHIPVKPDLIGVNEKINSSLLDDIVFSSGDFDIIPVTGGYQINIKLSRIVDIVSAMNVGASYNNLLTRSYNFTQLPWLDNNMGASYGTANGSILSPINSDDVTILKPNDRFSQLLYSTSAGTTLVNGITYTLWADVKAGSMTQIRPLIQGSAGGGTPPFFTFDLLNNTVTNENVNANATASIENLQTTLGSSYTGWYRVKVTFVSTGTAYENSWVFPQSVTGSGSDTFYIWRMQLELGSSVNTYVQKP